MGAELSKAPGESHPSVESSCPWDGVRCPTGTSLSSETIPGRTAVFPPRVHLANSCLGWGGTDAYLHGLAHSWVHVPGGRAPLLRRDAVIAPTRPLPSEQLLR